MEVLTAVTAAVVDTRPAASLDKSAKNATISDDRDGN